jgi:hypothetical protein
VVSIEIDQGVRDYDHRRAALGYLSVSLCYEVLKRAGLIALSSAEMAHNSQPSGDDLTDTTDPSRIIPAPRF